MDVGIAEGVVVDVGVGLVLAVGPLRDLFAEPLGRVVDHVVDGVLDRADVVAIDQLSEPLHAELRRSDLCTKVADVARDPVVRLERVEDVAAFDPAVEDLDHRPADTFAPDVRGGDVVATGNPAAGVAVVALDARDQHHAPSTRGGGIVGEDGREDVVVGKVPPAVVRVVGDEDITFAELLDTEELEREAHREGRRQHELRDADRQGREPAARVEDRGVALVRLVQDRRGRGARHVLRHLEAHRLHAAPDDLGGHEVDGGRFGDPAPATREANQVDVRHVLSPRETDADVREV